MVAQTPRKRVLRQYGYEPSVVSGVYRNQQPLLDRVQVIVLNQLQPTPHNAFVQCFASQRRVYQSAFERIQKFGQEQLSDHLWELVAGLRNQRDQKESDMAKVKQATAKQEEVLTAEKLMQIGRETRKFVLATMPPEQLLAGLALKDRLAGLVPKEQLAALTLEDVAKLMEQIEQFLSQHQSSGK